MSTLTNWIELSALVAIREAAHAQIANIHDPLFGEDARPPPLVPDTRAVPSPALVITATHPRSPSPPTATSDYPPDQSEAANARAAHMRLFYGALGCVVRTRREGAGT